MSSVARVSSPPPLKMIDFACFKLLILYRRLDDSKNAHHARVRIVRSAEQVLYVGSLHRNISPDESAQASDGYDSISPVRIRIIGNTQDSVGLQWGEYRTRGSHW